MKYVVITGASGGIGKATAIKLLEKDYYVIGLDIKENDLSNPNYFHICCDLTKKEFIDKVVAEITKITDHLYAIFNLAGIFMLQTLVEGNSDDLRKIIDVNFFAVYQINKALYPFLNKESRIIVFTSEVARYSPQPFNGYYALSKIIVDKYADVLRRELNYVGIKVCKVQSGAIKTNLLNGVNKQYENTLKNTTIHKKPLIKLKKLMDDEITKQIDPELVAKKLVKISFAKHLKLNYKFKNSLKLRFLNILPERLQDFIYLKAIR